MAENYDLIFSTKIDVDWDQDKIHQLGEAIDDLSGKVDLTKFDDNQIKELQEHGIDNVKNMFVQKNGMWEFADTIKQLGTGVIPSIVREIQTFGRALTDITRTERKYNSQVEADAKTATAYRTMINSGALFKDMSEMKIGSKGLEPIYADVVRAVSKRFDQLSRKDNQSYSRDVWGDMLASDNKLRREVAQIAKLRNVAINEDNDVTDLIKSGLVGIGSRAKISNARALFAPLYEHKERQNEPTDIFGNRALKELYLRDGELRGEKFVKGKNDNELSFSKGIYQKIRNLQAKGNRIAQDLALETGLATFSEMQGLEVRNSKEQHDRGLVLRWNKAPEGDRLRKFLGRTMQEARKIRSGQDIYQRDPDLNRNISKQFEEILEITQAFSESATGKDAEEFQKRFIESAGSNIDLSKLPAPVFGRITTKIQDTAGRIPTYGVPYTTLSEKDGKLVFEPRKASDMQKVVKSTGQLKTKSTDKGVLFEESQLTHLAGLQNAKNDPENPVIISMPVSDMWERDEDGFLRSGKDKRLTKAGKMQQDAITNGAWYNNNKYRFVSTNGESATFMREDEYLDRIAKAKQLGIDNPFEGYDPTIPDFLVKARNKETGEWETDLSKTNKMITSSKRIQTQGRALKDLVSENKRSMVENMKYGAISLQAQREINQQIGAETIGMLVDGAGFIDPSLSPFSFQARGLGEGFKGVLGNYDWRDFLRKTVKQSSSMKKSPFIKFDENGVLSNLYMPGVAFEHLEDADRKEIIRKLTSRQGSKAQKQNLLEEYFQDVMDPTLGALIFGDQLKTPAQMTVKKAEDYVSLMTGGRKNETDEEWQKISDKLLAPKREQGKNLSYIGPDGQEYVRLNNKETAKNIAESMKFGDGLFVVKSDEDFATGKRTIGQQVAEAIGFSPEMKKRSAELFAEQLIKMQTDDYWINEEKFSQRADLRNLFEQAEDKSAFLRDNPQAAAYIQSQIQAVKKKSMTHYMLDNDTDTRLAFPFLGSFFGDILSSTGAKVDQTSDLAWMYPQLLKNRNFLKEKLSLTDRALDKITPITNRDKLSKYGFTDEELAEITTIDSLKTAYDKKNNGKTISNKDLDRIRKGEDIDIEELMFSEDSDRLWSIAGRTPAAINTFSRMLNLAAAPKRASESGVRGGGNLRLVSPEGIYRMNTGDFDGDTIMMYAYANEKMFRDLAKINKTAVMDEKTQKEIDDLFESQMEELKSKKAEPTIGGRVAEQLYNFMSGQGEMGKASAIMRNALDLYDTRTEKGRRQFMQAYNLGSSAYDKATSQGQTMGWVGNYGHSYSNAAYLAGRQFSRFQKDISEEYLRPDEDKEFATQQSIFKNRLVSLKNMGAMVSAIEAGKLKQSLGLDFGFDDMVDDWISNKYGESSKGYNKRLFEVASDWGNILKGQYDLSHLVSNDDIVKFFKTSIDDLTVEASKAEKGSEEQIRLNEEIKTLKLTRDKMTRNADIRGGLLTADNLQAMIDMAPEGSPEKQFYERAQKIHKTMSPIEKIISDNEHQALIEEQVEAYARTSGNKAIKSADTVERFLDYWNDKIGGKNPSVTAMEPYIRNPTPAPVRRTRYDKQGKLIDYGTDNIIPDLWSKKYQEQGIASDIARAEGKPIPTDLDTLFGSFVHDVFSSTVLEDTASGSYSKGDFLKKAKERWDTGGFVAGSKEVTWKDYFTGKYEQARLKNPLSEEDWTKISDWLSKPDSNLENLKTLDPGVREKILETFTSFGNNSEFFLRDLFKGGKLFEAENEYIGPNGQKAFSPSTVKDPHDKKGIATTSYRPDLIWQSNDGWLDMYDWKPNEGGAGKSIYQMIHYAETARAEAERARQKQANGQALTSDDKRWLEYFDENGQFRIRNLVGKDYTGRGNDITFDYSSAANKGVVSAVMGNFETARDLYIRDRQDNSVSIPKGFKLLVDAGIIKKDEKISSALGKYFEYDTTYGDLEDAIKTYRENNGGAEFNGKDFVSQHNAEWNYLVAKQAQNRENLNGVMDNLRSTNARYNRRAQTDREYSKFDFLYDDLQKLNDPELVAALSAVYSDVLPYAIRDIGEYENDRQAQQSLLRRIVDSAAVQDPIQTENALRRQLYHSKGSNIFNDVQSVIGRANEAAGSRQTYKKFYDEFFNNPLISGETADNVWENAGRIQQQLDKQNGKYTTKEGKKAKQDYDDFIASINEQYGLQEKGINLAAFMADAGKYANAQANIDTLRATEQQLITQLYENDRKQTAEDVDNLIARNKTPQELAQVKIDKRRKDITDYIAASKLDIQETDTNINKWMESLSRDFLRENDKQLKKAVSTGDIGKINDLVSKATKEDSGVLGNIKNLIMKKDTLQNAISVLDNYLNNGFNDFSSNVLAEEQNKSEISRMRTFVQGTQIADLYSRAYGPEQISASTMQDSIAQQAKYAEMMNHFSALETIDKLKSLGSMTTQEQQLYNRLFALDTRDAALQSVRNAAIAKGATDNGNAAVQAHIETATQMREAEEKVEAEKLQTRQRNIKDSYAERNKDLAFQSAEAQYRRDRQYEQQSRQAWGGSRSAFVNSYLRQQEIRSNLQEQARIADRGIDRLSNKDTGVLARLERERALLEKTKGKEHPEYLAKAQEIKEATQQLEDYKKASEDAKQQMKQFAPASNLMRAGLTGITDTVDMLVKRFGRQMFYKAINEAKQFVKQFDKSMTEIQMITLKSDEQMSTLGTGLIGKAKELKISISEISQSAATLYRQGLSDQEVNDRLDVISKFSKVSGTKVADATKLITVAMNTGLVTDASEAADIVTALGDNAATNAQQIEKGIEKAGAAAAADGTTFGQLAAMLTAITSTTQIGGNVAGRTLNTIIGRMNKIGTNELIYDENGNAISGSAVAKLLKAQGIDMYDRNGNKRSTYDTLYALSQKWEGMSDAEQQQMANAIAGTRQYSNFSAIMQGMSEGKVDEYMALLGESSGITDKKFEVYTKSLEAALTDFRNTFDSVVQDLADKGLIKDIAKSFGDIVTGIGDFVSASGGLESVIGILATIAVLTSTIRGGLAGAVASIALIGGLSIASAIGSAKRQSQEKEKSLLTDVDRYTNYESNAQKEIDQRQKLIDRTKELGKKYNAGTISTTETDELASSLQRLNTIYGDLGTSATGASDGLKDWEQNCENAQKKTDELKESIKETTKEMAEAAIEQKKDEFRTNVRKIKEETAFSPENLSTLQGVDVVHSVLNSPSNKWNTWFGKNGFVETMQNKYELTEEDVLRYLFGNELYNEYASPETTNQRKQEIKNQWVADKLEGANGDMDLKFRGKATSTTGALSAILADVENNNYTRDGINRYSGSGSVVFSKEQEKAYNALLSSIYASPGGLASILPNEADRDWLYGIENFDESKFVEYVRNGFKDADVTKMPEGFLQRMYLGIAQAISGENNYLSSLYGDSSDKIQEQADYLLNEEFETRFKFANLDTKYKDVIRNNAKERLSQYSPDTWDKYTSQVVEEEIKKAQTQGEKYIKENVEQEAPLTLGDLVGNMQVESKDLKYAKEYASLLRIARSAKDINQLGKASGQEYIEFIQSNKDATLTSMWQDLQSNKGNYNYQDLITYLESAVYGSTEAKSTNQLMNTAYSLSDMRNNLAEMKRSNGSESLYKTIADATGIPVDIIRSNYTYGVEEYEKNLNEIQAQYEANIRKRIAQDFGEIDQNKVYSDAEVEKMNKRYASLGIKISKRLPTQGRHGEGLDIDYGHIPATPNANLRDYSPLYTNKQIVDIAQRMKGMSWDDIVNGISDGKWTQEDVSAVMSSMPDLKRYAMMSPEQQTSQEGLNLERKINISFIVSGLQELEKAGLLLDGTTNKIEKLHENEQSAAQVIKDITTEGFASGQQYSQLIAGSKQQQDETAMNILGMSREQYYSNRDINRQAAIAYMQQMQPVNANTWSQLYNNATTDDQKQAILSAAQSAGYDITGIEAQYGSRGRTETATFGWTGNVELANVGSLKGTQQIYSDIEKQRMLSNIINGKVVRTTGREGNADLYDLAVESAGTYAKQYLWQTQNGVTPSSELKRLARLETEKSLKETEEQKVLEDARINASTAGGILDYQTLKYQQQNKAGLAANRIYESMSGINPEGVTSLSDLTNVLNQGNVKSWKDLLENNEELAKKISDAGIKFDGDKFDVSGLVGGSEAAASALQMLAQSVAQASEAYSKQTEVLSQGDLVDRALAYANGKAIPSEEQGFDAYAEAIGNKELANLVRNKRLTYDSAMEQYPQKLAEYEFYSGLSASDKRVYEAEHGRPKKPVEPTMGDLSGELNPFEYRYASMLEENLSNGITGGLTNEQRDMLAQEILQAAQKGPEALKEFREGSKINAIADVLSGIDNADQLLNDIADGGSNAEKAMRQLRESMDERAVKDITKYGKSLGTTAEALTKIRKGGKDAAEGAAMIRSKFKNLQDQMTAVNKAKGKSGKQIDNKTLGFLDQIFPGLSSTDLKQKTKEEMDDLLKDVPKSIDEVFTENLQAIWDDAINQAEEMAKQQNIDFNLGDIGVTASGTPDFSKLNPAIADMLNGAWEMLANAAGEVGTLKLEQITGPDFVKIIAHVLGGKKYNGGGGGGGGGGKSDVDKLLEKQKHKLAQVQHEQKMLEIEESRYQYNNNYSAWFNNIDAQIAKQKELSDVYAQNIQELEKMLKKTKEGSDDYYKLRDAINEAQEAMSEIINKINELNSKRTTIIQTRIDNRKYPREHRTSMLDLYAERALNQDRFSDYDSISRDAIKSRRKEIRENENSIEEWKKELANVKKNTERWHEIRQKIYELEEENAQKENEIIQQQLELFRWRLSRVAQVLQQNTMTENHRMNLADMYGGSYESLGYRKQYESMIKQRIKMSNSLIESNKKAEEEARNLMNNEKKGSTVWYEARDAMFQYQEAIAELINSIWELNHALEESKIEGINETFRNATMDIDHVNEMLSSFAQDALERNDYDAYFAAMDEYLDNMNDKLPAAEKRLNGLINAYNKGMASEEGLDNAARLAYLEAINEAESDIYNLTAEIEKQQREIVKTQLQRVFDQQSWTASEYDHNQRLLGYASSQFKSNGELTNYNNAIQKDNELRRERIEQLEDEQKALYYWMDMVEEGSKEEQRLVEAIRKNEEAIANENSQIDKNTQLLEENEKKIRQVRKALEDSVDKEIEAQKKREREILAANVSMQNTLVELLRKRLSDEWALKKKDLEKEKESLNEYKQLINERFNYRKKASQQADKEEELADYRRQLALIEADVTRSKEAKELRRKIEDLEKENAWTIAEDELNAENERIDDEMTGVDKFVQYNEELLNQILGDANNFADQLNEIISGSFEESYQKIIGFMQKENEAFMKSLPDAQKQMIQSWEDTWKKANDIIDSNYAQITEVIGDKDTYMDFMKATDRTYRLYAENGDLNSMAILEQQWSDTYDNFTKSLINTFDFDKHLHELREVNSHIDQLADSIFDVNVINFDGSLDDPYGYVNKWDNVDTKDFSSGETPEINTYGDISKKLVRQEYKPVDANTHKIINVYSNGDKEDAGTEPHTFNGDTCTKCGYKKEAEANNSQGYSAGKYKMKAVSDAPKDGQYAGKSYIGIGAGGTEQIAANIAIRYMKAKLPSDYPYSGATLYRMYKEGGLVNYTGPAWVDGTKTRPEAFLNATDTANIRSLLDMFDYVINTPYMSNLDSASYGDTTNVGDINITINQAELKSDADINKLARQVGQAFTRELQHNGLNLAGYSFG